MEMENEVQDGKAVTGRQAFNGQRGMRLTGRFALPRNQSSAIHPESLRGRARRHCND